MYFSIQDDCLRNDIVKNFDDAIECAFKRDIIKTTEDFCRGLSCSHVSFDKTALLAVYLKAIGTSKFKDLMELKDIFQSNIDDNMLVEAIERCTSNKVYLRMFGVEPPIGENKEEKDNNGKEI